MTSVLRAVAVGALRGHRAFMWGDGVIHTHRISHGMDWAGKDPRGHPVQPLVQVWSSSSCSVEPLKQEMEEGEITLPAHLSSPLPNLKENTDFLK